MHLYITPCTSVQQKVQRQEKLQRNPCAPSAFPVSLVVKHTNQFSKKTPTASVILSLSASVKLEPEGKHNPFSNKPSATLVP